MLEIEIAWGVIAAEEVDLTMAETTAVEETTIIV